MYSRALGVQGLGFRDEPVEFVSSPFQGVEFRLYMGVHKGTLALRQRQCLRTDVFFCRRCGHSSKISKSWMQLFTKATLAE